MTVDWEQEKENCKQFRPDLYVLTSEEGPSSISLAALCGSALRKINVGVVNEIPFLEELEFAGQIFEKT